MHLRLAQIKKKSVHIHVKFIRSHPYSCWTLRTWLCRHKKFASPEVRWFSLGGENRSFNTDCVYLDSGGPQNEADLPSRRGCEQKETAPSRDGRGGGASSVRRGHPAHTDASHRVHAHPTVTSLSSLTATSSEVKE